MGLEQLLSGDDELHGNELESLGFEAANNLANKSTLDAIGLDHNEGSFLLLGLHLWGYN